MTYYRNRARFTTNVGAAPRTMSEKQRDFAGRLMADIETLESGMNEAQVAMATEMLGTITGTLSQMLSENWSSVTTAAASSVIDTLINLKRTLENGMAATRAIDFSSEYPSLPSGVTQVITSRYAGRCGICGEKVTPNEDIAARRAGGWNAYHKVCAQSDPTERAAAAEAERAAAEAQAEAERVAAAAFYEAGMAVYAAAGKEVGGNPSKVAFAYEINGKLRFFVLRTVNHRGRFSGFSIMETLGGMGEGVLPVALAQRTEIAEDIAFMGSKGIVAAIARYGKELGVCGSCFRTLTDEESRKFGIGPICRDRLA